MDCHRTCTLLYSASCRVTTGPSLTSLNARSVLRQTMGCTVGWLPPRDFERVVQGRPDDLASVAPRPIDSGPFLHYTPFTLCGSQRGRSTPQHERVRTSLA